MGTFKAVSASARAIVVRGTLVLAAATWCSLSLAGVICPSRLLPPQEGAACGIYIGDMPIEFPDALGPGQDLTLTDVRLFGFRNITRVLMPDGEIVEYDSTLTVLATAPGSPATPVGKFTFGSHAFSVLPFLVTELEMFEGEVLELSGTGDFMGTPVSIRESPTLASTGITTVEDFSPGDGNPNNGPFDIQSFFDVFTEVRIGDGAFIPAEGPLRLTLVPTALPVPGTLPLFLAGVLVMGWLRRTRQARAMMQLIQ